MKILKLCERVQGAVQIAGISSRTAAEGFGINARTSAKMPEFMVPPAYFRTLPPFRAKLDAFTGIIGGIMPKDCSR